MYFTARDGTTVVVKRGPDLEILATNKLDDVFDGSMALVGNEIFLRSREQPVLHLGRVSRLAASIC